MLKNYADKGDYKQTVRTIVYTNAFKRSSNKSQIMIKPIRDHFRSRLVHTEEVNQIALEIGNNLELNLGLISSIAMGHDIGHTPFGHAGERAVQDLLKRELNNSFHLSEKKNLGMRNIFHHSSNSARILLKKIKGDLNDTVLDGILNHSWSPWKNNNYQAPNTYEGQVVAISDQIASINHDTEDIIDGHTFTNYDHLKYHRSYVDKFQKEDKTLFQRISDKVELFTNDSEPGYGRDKRVKTIISEINDSVDILKMKLEKTNNNKDNIPRLNPIMLSAEWNTFLKCYESFIRDDIIGKQSWFVGRDAMATALISTVFNHLWPVFKEGEEPPLFKDLKEVKSSISKETKYLEHYQLFYKDEYKNKYSEFLDYLKTRNITTWDKYIYEILHLKPNTDEFSKYERLISIIDFISGLTDRYCLEIFDSVYHDFLI